MKTDGGCSEPETGDKVELLISVNPSDTTISVNGKRLRSCTAVALWAGVCGPTHIRLSLYPTDPVTVSGFLVAEEDMREYLDYKRGQQCT